MKDLYERFGFWLIAADEDGTTHWRYDLGSQGAITTEFIAEVPRLMTVHERLQEVARSLFDDEDLVLADETTAADVPGWDSLAHVNFMYSVEEEFDVRFSDDEFAGFSNIAALRDTLEAKLALGNS